MTVEPTERTPELTEDESAALKEIVAAMKTWNGERAPSNDSRTSGKP